MTHANQYCPACPHFGMLSACGLKFLLNTTRPHAPWNALLSGSRHLDETCLQVQAESNVQLALVPVLSDVLQRQRNCRKVCCRYPTEGLLTYSHRTKLSDAS